MRQAFPTRLLGAGLGAVLSFAISLGSAFGANSEGEARFEKRRRLKALIHRCESLDKAGDIEGAYLSLSEAYRLEQVWTANTFNDSTLVPDYLAHFVAKLARRQDAALPKILNSRRIPLSEKLNLLKWVEQEIILDYSGQSGGWQADSTLLSGPFD